MSKIMLKDQNPLIFSSAEFLNFSAGEASGTIELNKFNRISLTRSLQTAQALLHTSQNVLSDRKYEFSRFLRVTWRGPDC